ncbi:hypothetical protein GR183_19845 [Stappia sp. GBMRC 2046]|uniref:Uncharacterized protein n=1 Tax=Stappia sediminis TaxID=2692190 RepID=A0A7X3S9R5_9HYPH|nr:hypothetical protein [Stappia sediminis]MXN67168.1 hypothetical protein [Stappia sediminis]
MPAKNENLIVAPLLWPPCSGSGRVNQRIFHNRTGHIELNKWSPFSAQSTIFSDFTESTLNISAHKMPRQKTNNESKSPKFGLDRWDDDGGASNRDSMYNEYGRRIEGDGTWTVYHVFTGVPATIGGQIMKGMNASDSMTRMMLTNSHNSKQRKAYQLQFPVRPPHSKWRKRISAWFNRRTAHTAL